MVRYVAMRLIYAVLVVLVVSMLIFLLIHLLPGDPITIMLGEHATPQLEQELKKLYALDKPIYEQYFIWIKNILKGTWGVSIRSRRPVLTSLATAFEPSLLLALGGWLVSFIVGVGAGVIAALYRSTWRDYIASTLAFIGLSTPQFFLGILLMLLFAYHFKILPPTGYISPFVDPLGAARHLLLPVLTIGLSMAAVVARITRSSVLEVIREEYVRTARAKGLPEKTVILKHVLRPALITIVTVSGLQLGYLLGGVVVVENVFAVPGLGRLIVSATFLRDYPVVQGCVLIFATWFTMVNLAVDLSYTALDPRIRFGE